MERAECTFTYNDVEKLSNIIVKHGAMVQQVGEIKSFPLELVMIASVLRENSMPQTTINMVLAARCGLPVQAVDLRSSYFVWAESEQCSEEASRTQDNEGVTPGQHLAEISKDIIKHIKTEHLPVKIRLHLIPGEKNLVAESTLLVNTAIAPALGHKREAKQQES